MALLDSERTTYGTSLEPCEALVGSEGEPRRGKNAIATNLRALLVLAVSLSSGESGMLDSAACSAPYHHLAALHDLKRESLQLRNRLEHRTIPASLTSPYRYRAVPTPDRETGLWE